MADYETMHPSENTYKKYQPSEKDTDDDIDEDTDVINDC